MSPYRVTCVSALMGFSEAPPGIPGAGCSTYVPNYLDTEDFRTLLYHRDLSPIAAISANPYCISRCEGVSKVNIGDLEHASGQDQVSVLGNFMLSGLRAAGDALRVPRIHPHASQHLIVNDIKGMERRTTPGCVPCVILLLDETLAITEDGNPLRPQLCDTIRKLCQMTDLLPSSYIISLDLPNIELSRIDGQGGFATVRRGKYQGDDVALKKFRHVPSSTEGVRLRKYIYRELFILRYIHHPNIVSFRGVHNYLSTLYIVYDWMNQGTVNDYLGVYVSADRVKLLRDIATGMNHLHNNGVVHGDLKGANVLVDEDGIARIADFGLSSFTYEDKIETDTELTGSTRWMAPELFDPDEFHGKTVRTTYSDVYAFAMTAIEIFSSEKPFRNISKYAVIPRVLKGIRPDRPCVNPALGLSDSIWGLMKRCWHQDPGKRPAFAVILQSLGSEPGEFPGVG